MPNGTFSAVYSVLINLPTSEKGVEMRCFFHSHFMYTSSYLHSSS